MATRLLYLSTPQFGIPALRRLTQDSRFELVGVVTQPDKPAGRGLKLAPPPIKTAALKLGLKVLQPPSLRTPEAQAAIRALQPDLIAVAAYGQWIPAEVYDLPPLRSINLHPSLLPRHRGAAPVISALLAGDAEVGLSVLFVEDEMDAGDLLAQMRVPLAEGDTTACLMARLAEIGAPFFADALAAWAAGAIGPQPQDHSQSTWIDRLEKKAGRIDWRLPAAEIARHCRAFQPWPGSYTFFDGRRLLIHRALALPLLDATLAAAEPGTVIRFGRQVGVITGDGVLQFKVIQLEGRRALPIDDFCPGQRHFIGARLG
ncbi:MAG: methionyl-tRNA formyltransferase [Chloroflexota bacterium]